MNILNIQECADFFRKYYLKTFYLVTTYNGKSFILVGEKGNFPHLMGIQKNTYRSNGYNKPQFLFNDIISKKAINPAIIPHNISNKSKMYKKVLNFTKSSNLFWKNAGPLTVNYNPTLSNTKLSNVDILLTDINTGYMLGWVSNKKVPINESIRIEKYCICSWIDESSGTSKKKEKYLPNQNIELIRYVFAFDENSKLIRKKEYIYDYTQKQNILISCERNNCNLLIDARNAHNYIQIARKEHIHSKINNVQY